MSSNGFKADIQKPVLEGLVELYHVDLTPLGVSAHFYWTSSINPNDEPIQWKGNVYLPAPILGSGFEHNAQGQFPRPKFQVSNVLQLAESVVRDYDEMLGAIVTRWRVLKPNLDNGSNPDPNAHFPVEIYRIDRRTAHNAVFVEFELSSVLDQEGVMLPRRQVLKVCSHTYRVWNPSTNSFTYQNVTCPYAGNKYYDKDGVLTTDPSKDSCSKLFSTGCRMRFGKNPLPFRGFVGVQRRGY